MYGMYVMYRNDHERTVDCTHVPGTQTNDGHVEATVQFDIWNFARHFPF